MNFTDINTNLSTDLNGTFSRLAVPFFIPPNFFKAYNIYLYIMIASGLVGNFVVLVVFLRHPPSTTTDWFILFITSCDFITSLVNTPIYVTFTNGIWRYYGTTTICTLHMFISQSVVLSSSFLIAGLSLDRYLKVCRQMSSFTKAKARNSCFGIFVLTTLLSTPCFVMYENRRGQCVSIVMDTHLFAYYMMVFLIFVFASSVVVFSYYMVTRAVQKSEANVRRHNGLSSLPSHESRCCCFPTIYRQNRIAPSNMSRSGLFRDTFFRTTEAEHSEKSDSLPQPVDKDHLTIPSKSGVKNQEKNLNVLSSLSNKDTKPAINGGNTSGHVTNKDTKSKINGENTSGHVTTTSNREEPSSVSNYTQSRQTRPASHRTTKIAFLVCSIFIVTWIPPWVSFILASVPGMKNNVEVVKFMIFGKMTFLINIMTNPIVYTWLNKKFRKDILEIFCCKST